MSRSSREYEEWREQQEQAAMLAAEQAWADMARYTENQRKLGM
ncbi:hypothetical protein [Mesorhizobium sp. ES1-1]|nr:hypothetical protein [Mesorhizobium sp. ES1-1]